MTPESVLKVNFTARRAYDKIAIDVMINPIRVFTGVGKFLGFSGSSSPIQDTIFGFDDEVWIAPAPSRRGDSSPGSVCSISRMLIKSGQMSKCILADFRLSWSA
jgi:hypothetical protein